MLGVACKQALSAGSCPGIGVHRGLLLLPASRPHLHRAPHGHGAAREVTLGLYWGLSFHLFAHFSPSQVILKEACHPRWCS